MANSASVVLRAINVCFFVFYTTSALAINTIGTGDLYVVRKCGSLDEFLSSESDAMEF